MSPNSLSMQSLYIFSKICIEWDRFYWDKVTASQPEGSTISYVSKQGSRQIGKFEAWTVIHEAILIHHATGYTVMDKIAERIVNRNTGGI